MLVWNESCYVGSMPWQFAGESPTARATCWRKTSLCTSTGDILEKLPATSFGSFPKLLLEFSSNLLLNLIQTLLQTSPEPKFSPKPPHLTAFCAFPKSKSQIWIKSTTSTYLILLEESWCKFSCINMNSQKYLAKFLPDLCWKSPMQRVRIAGIPNHSAWANLR